MTDTPSPAAHRILEAALDIGARDGADAIGARAIARAIGISPSLVSYHFKGTDALLLALHDSLVRAHYDDLAAMAREVAALPGHLVSPSAFLAGAATHFAHARRPRTILLFELHMRAALGGYHVDAAPAHAAMRAVGDLLGIADDDALWTWGLILHAGAWYALLDDSPLLSQTWLSRVYARFVARMNATADAPLQSPRPTPAPVRDIAPDAEPSRPPRAQMVIEAAIRLISRGEKVTHRTIASEARLPLATTTYLFASKRDILGEAYRHIHHMVAQGGGGGLGDVPVNLIDADGRLPRNRALFGTMLLQLARDHDNPGLARNLRENGAADGLGVLRRHGLAADALDGQLMSMCMGPVSPAIFGVPRDERYDDLRRHIDGTLLRLFGASNLV